MGITRAAAEELRAKYAEMLSMRIRHDAGAEPESEARERMAALASRFPGALREIDSLELNEIRRRIEALDAVLTESVQQEPWMEAVAVFHELARGALAVKAWLAGRRRVDATLEGAFAADAERLPFPQEVRGWAGDLERLAAPPRGRLMDLVFGRVAARLGTTEREARRLVFGEPRARRRG